MRYRPICVAIIALAVLAGCSKPVAVEYNSSLSQVASMSADPGIATATPTAFRIAEKKDTVVAGSTGGAVGGATGASSGGSGIGRAEATISPSHPSSSGTVTIVVKVTTSGGVPVAGARVTLTCRYWSTVLLVDPIQTKTFTMTSNSAGVCRKTLDATPFDGPTTVAVGGSAVINGQKCRVTSSGYSVP